MASLKQILLYAGLEKKQMDRLLPEAREENRRNLSIYSSMMALIFSVCLIISYVAGGELVVNRPIYITMIITGFMLYLCSQLVIPKHLSLSLLFVMIFIISVYGYAFTVSLLHVEMPGASAVAILLVMPALFNYRPILMIIMTIAASTAYCLLSASIKARPIAMLDLWNSLFFAVIAILLSVYLMRVKFRMLWQKQENRYLSETDILTDVKNRNCFEKNREKYQTSCQNNLACVFADANGLHELNDAEGHEEGDELLKTVASAMIQVFGSENIYRIGGDEFLAICMDTPVEKISENARKIVRKVAEAGYSVSIGFSVQDRQEADIRTLTRKAEKAMYKQKTRYYQQTNHDRRSRMSVDPGIQKAAI